ncbi:MAG: ilvB [Bacillales bacterium]|jgi:acetolactate synthase-1/2/3 large subunit|nr:ilvB [Bacillales bacterium]
MHIQKVNEISGAQILIESIKAESVELIFGYPGGAVLPIYDVLYDANIRHILTRHEQGAIHAAEGYARISGKPGVVIATSGPGATNLITGLANAMMDSTPLVVFTGQVGTATIGTDAFQEADIIGLTMPVTKHNYQVRDASDIPRIVKEAFHIATTGRPGPVVIDLPRDVVQTRTTKKIEEKVLYLPGYQPTYEPNHGQIEKLVNAIKNSKKPVILSGGGVLISRAAKELTDFADKHKIPVVNTLLGLGSFPATHELFLGMGGMHGTYAANNAMFECDLLISIGARFDDRLTCNTNSFAKNAVIVHIDIDPAEIGKIIKTDIPIVGDAKRALNSLLNANFEYECNQEWLDKLMLKKTKYPLWYTEQGTALRPQRVVETIHKYSDENTIVASDVGQNQMFAAQFYKHDFPHKWVSSGGLGTMGFGLPSAIGAQFADPDATVIAILGDGGFQMTIQELGVIQEYGLPLKIFILNNNALGMVRQWQESFYNKRYSNSILESQPNFSKVAEAYGIHSVTINNPENVETEIQLALAHNGPIVVDCRVTQYEKVLPMVPPGRGINEMEGIANEADNYSNSVK